MFSMTMGNLFSKPVVGLKKASFLKVKKLFFLIFLLGIFPIWQKYQ